MWYFPCIEENCKAATDILCTYQILILANFMLNKSVQYNTSHEKINRVGLRVRAFKGMAGTCVAAIADTCVARLATPFPLTQNALRGLPRMQYVLRLLPVSVLVVMASRRSGLRLYPLVFHTIIVV
jgi:hypothetical protein